MKLGRHFEKHAYQERLVVIRIAFESFGRGQNKNLIDLIIIKIDMILLQCMLVTELLRLFIYTDLKIKLHSFVS